MEMTPEQMAQFQAAMQQQSQQPAAAGLPAPVGGLPSLGDAKAGNVHSKWLAAGDYVVDVTEVKAANTFKGLYFIVVFDIVESTNPSIPAGSTGYSWSKCLDIAKDQYGYNRNDVKGWICSAIKQLMPGSSPENEWDDRFTYFVTDEKTQPCKGLRFFCNVYDKPNKKAPGTFTIVNWESMAAGDSRGLVPVAGAAPAVPAAPNPAAAPVTPGLPASLLGKLGQ